MGQSNWTDELKQEVIDAYKEMNPTAENSAEIVKELAETYDKTVNGLRMILTKAGVYIKKSTDTTKNSESKTTRVSKADAIQALTSAIEAAGVEVDDSITSKLTGKAALYFSTIITSILERDADNND